MYRVATGYRALARGFPVPGRGFFRIQLPFQPLAGPLPMALQGRDAGLQIRDQLCRLEVRGDGLDRLFELREVAAATRPVQPLFPRGVDDLPQALAGPRGTLVQLPLRSPLSLVGCERSAKLLIPDGQRRQIKAVGLDNPPAGVPAAVPL